MSITIPVITVEGLSQHVISAIKIGTRYYVTVDGATLENFESGFTPYEAIEYYIHVNRPTAIPFWNAAQAQLDAIISEEENRRERLAALNIFEAPVCEEALEVEAPAAEEFASFEDYRANVITRLREGVAKHGNRVQSVIVDTFESDREDEEIIVTAAAEEALTLEDALNSMSQDDPRARDAAFELAKAIIDRAASDETALNDIETALATATIDERLNLMLVRRVWEHQSELATQRKLAEWKARKNPAPAPNWHDKQFARFFI